GEDALAVPDRLRHQRAADHLHLQGPAIRHRAVGNRRRVLEPGARGAQGRAARRLGVDLRPDAGLKTWAGASSRLGEVAWSLEPWTPRAAHLSRRVRACPSRDEVE